MQPHPAQNTVQDAGHIGQGGSFGRPAIFGKAPPKHAAGPRDCPCRPRAPERVGVRVRARVRVSVRVRVRVRPGVGLVWVNTVEIDGDTRSCVQDAAAHSPR